MKCNLPSKCRRGQERSRQSSKTKCIPPWRTRIEARLDQRSTWQSKPPYLGLMAARSNKTPTSFKFFPPKWWWIFFVSLLMNSNNRSAIKGKISGISSFDLVKLLGIGRRKVLLKKPQSNFPFCKADIPSTKFDFSTW